MSSRSFPPYIYKNEENVAIYIPIYLFVIIGIIASYLPQFYRIISRSSSLGFSPWFIFLGLLGSTFTFFNGVMLYTHLLVHCTQHNNISTCILDILGLAQLGVGFLMFTILFILYFVYYPEQNKRPIDDPINLTSEWESSLLVLFLSIGLVFITIFTSLLLIIVYHSESLHRYVMIWGSILGYLASLCAAIQYLPQIQKTWRMKSPGSLSITMMSIQTPGTLIFIYILARREGIHYTTWLPFAVAASLQGIVLCLCIYFEYIRGYRHDRIQVDANVLGVSLESVQE